jgi:hypothetical protein
MPGKNLWELEKFRRRLGLTRDELRSATQELTRKQRSSAPLNYVEEITRDRINRRKAREREYWDNLEELTNLVADDPKAVEALKDRLIELYRNNNISHAVLLDFAICFIRVATAKYNISDPDRDNAEGAVFYLERPEPPDGPRRRRTLPKHLKVVETLLRELRASKQIT